MKKNPVKKVCIFGSYRDLDKKQKNEIVRLGKLLAREGFTVVSGGFGGTMEDISRGAKAAGGKTIGVTYYKWESPLYKKANKFIDKEIVTKHLFDRVDVMVKTSDAFVVFPGGTGTLLELSAVLEYLNKGLMASKPVIALGNYWKPVLTALKRERISSEKMKNLRKISYCDELVAFVKTPEECIKSLAKQMRLSSKKCR